MQSKDWRKMLTERLKAFKRIELRSALKSLAAVNYTPFAVIFFMAVMTYLSVGILYKVIGITLINARPEKAAQAATEAKSLIAGAPIGSYQIIIERNLFGTTDKLFAYRQTGEKAAGAPDDVLGMFDLRGTVAGDGRYAFAVMEDKTKRKQALYKIGDHVGSGKLVRILRNSVVVQIGGENRTLKIAETKETSIVGPTPIAQAPMAAPPFSGNAPPGSTPVNRSEINDGLKNIGSMLSQANIRPYFSMGAPDGFLITNIRAGSIYQKLGIANGDVIQGINDRPIKTADDMMQFYNTIKSASNVTLNIKRQGRPERLNFVIR